MDLNSPDGQTSKSTIRMQLPHPLESLLEQKPEMEQVLELILHLDGFDLRVSG